MHGGCSYVRRLVLGTTQRSKKNTRLGTPLTLKLALFKISSQHKCNIYSGYTIFDMASEWVASLQMEPGDLLELQLSLYLGD